MLYSSSEVWEDVPGEWSKLIKSRKYRFWSDLTNCGYFVSRETVRHPWHQFAAEAYGEEVVRFGDGLLQVNGVEDIAVDPNLLEVHHGEAIDWDVFEDKLLELLASVYGLANPKIIRHEEQWQRVKPYIPWARDTDL